jgi:hypothetical protein
VHRKRPQPDNFNFAAAKRTVDELLAQVEEFNRAGATFLKLDLQTALTFTASARQTDDAVRKRRNCQSARRAYDAVQRFAGEIPLGNEDARILAVNLGRLKSELQSLGEVF